jgi:SAM-dependent methyltransferase
MERPAVAVTLAADTRQAFDSVAAEYDRTNAENPILSEMRRRMLDVVLGRVQPGAHVLDLGCGPGADAVAVAAAGCFVTAIDLSPRMVEEARRLVAAAGLESRGQVRQVRIEELDRVPGGPFDAAYSDFGPLNCVDDLGAAAAAVARRLRPGGVLVASVIGRVCPWEIALYLSRGNLSRARVRLARGPVAVPLNGHIVWTRYYMPREFARPFEAAGFARVSLRSLGLLVPPPYMEAFAARRPRVVAALQQLEDRVASWPIARQLGDHFLIVMTRVDP